MNVENLEEGNQGTLKILQNICIQKHQPDSHFALSTGLVSTFAARHTQPFFICPADMSILLKE